MSGSVNATVKERSEPPSPLPQEVSRPASTTEARAAATERDLRTGTKRDLRTATERDLRPALVRGGRGLSGLLVLDRNEGGNAGHLHADKGGHNGHNRWPDPQLVSQARKLCNRLRVRMYAGVATVNPSTPYSYEQPMCVRELVAHPRRVPAFRGRRGRRT
ncbi:hypothetical protein GCM10010252_71750 [Streptomyces aureoverticillatus]|nr:hypothetical protein GCM10010252_71750 [Streptomyces aureoverticillatus]